MIVDSVESFNWATSFQTWKYGIEVQYLLAPRMFQLGHVFSDMEISFGDVVDMYRRRVSIGPRLFRHGNALK